MIAWVGVAVTLLASPADRGGPQPRSSDVLSPPLIRQVREIGPAARLEAMLGELAVVRPGTLGAAVAAVGLLVVLALPERPLRSSAERRRASAAEAEPA